MKKLILLFIVLFVATGCGNDVEKNQEKLENHLKTYYDYTCVNKICTVLKKTADVSIKSTIDFNDNLYIVEKEDTSEQEFFKTKYDYKGKLLSSDIKKNYYDKTFGYSPILTNDGKYLCTNAVGTNFCVRFKEYLIEVKNEFNDLVRASGLETKDIITKK